jgi:hypothetical protein
MAASDDGDGGYYNRRRWSHGRELIAWTIGSCQESLQRVLETTVSNDSDPRNLLRRRALRAAGQLQGAPGSASPDIPGYNGGAPRLANL